LLPPVTANANFGNYDVTARMEQSFKDFEGKFGGKVFIIFSIEDKIANNDIYEKTEAEILRLQKYIL